MNHDRGAPADESRQLEAAHHGDAGVAADGGHGALVEVPKWLGWGLAGLHSAQDGPCHVSPFLHRGRREHRQFTVFRVHSGDVSDGEGPVHAADPQPIVDLNPLAATVRDVLVLCRVLRLDAGGPDNCPGGHGRAIRERCRSGVG